MSPSYTTETILSLYRPEGSLQITFLPFAWRFILNARVETVDTFKFRYMRIIFHSVRVDALYLNIVPLLIYLP